MFRFHRFTAAVLCVAAFASTASAQWRSGRTTMGLYGGMNYTTAEGKDVSGPGYRDGLVGGAFLVWRMSDMFGLQPEVQFSQEGTKFSQLSGGTSYAGDLKLDYIQIPLLLRISPPLERETVEWHMLVGPFVAFKSSCGVSMTPRAPGQPTSCGDLGSLNSIDYGAMAGIGVDFKVGAQFLTFSTRYHMGVPDVVKDNAGKNRGFTFVVGTRW